METFVKGCVELLDEAFEGPADPRQTWVVSNEPDSGLLGTIEPLTAEDASREPAPSARTVASHVEHERFALDVARRRLMGEEVTDSWDYSWRIPTVTEPMWSNLRAELRRAYAELRAVIDAKVGWGELDIKGLAATVAHLTYHLGAVRQIVRVLHAKVA